MSKASRVSLTALGLALVMAACGLENDTAPRDVGPADAPERDVAVSSTQPSLGLPLRLYLLVAPAGRQAQVLQPVPRVVEPTPAALFASLVAGPTASDPDGLRSAVPNDVTLIGSPTLRGGVVTLDLTTEIDTATGETLIEAMAQIVFTMTELPAITGVRLTVEGEQREWPTGDGSLTRAALTEFDFPELNPTSQPDYPAPAAPITETTAG